MDGQIDPIGFKSGLGTRFTSCLQMVMVVAVAIHGGGDAVVVGGGCDGGWRLSKREEVDSS